MSARSLFRSFLFDPLRHWLDQLPPRPDSAALVALAERYGLHVYDAGIVASAIGAGCERLYSEDLQHGQRIESVTVIDPFR